jgi:hypothetical protein
MYFRCKTSAGPPYLQIVENRGEGDQVRQQVIDDIASVTSTIPPAAAVESTRLSRYLGFSAKGSCETLRA